MFHLTEQPLTLVSFLAEVHFEDLLKYAFENTKGSDLDIQRLEKTHMKVKRVPADGLMCSQRWLGGLGSRAWLKMSAFTPPLCARRISRPWGCRDEQDTLPAQEEPGTETGECSILLSLPPIKVSSLKARHVFLIPKSLEPLNSGIV